MRKPLILLPLFLAAGVAFALVPPVFLETQALSRPVPDGGESSAIGMAIGGIRSYRVTVCAANVDGGSVNPDAGTMTLSGAGTVQMYYYNPKTQFWARNPTLDTNVTATGQCQTFPDVQVPNSTNGARMLPAASGVTASTGNVNIDVSTCLWQSLPSGGC